MALTCNPRVGLESRHRRTAVVQDDEDDVRLLMDGVDQRGNGRMVEGRIPADGEHRLVHAEGPSLPNPEARPVPDPIEWRVLAVWNPAAGKREAIA